MKTLAILLLLTACASAPDSAPESFSHKVSESAFQKEKPLLNSQVPDYYQPATSALSPALQDETIDRYNKKELDGLKADEDPLLGISLNCHRSDYLAAFQIASRNFARYQKVAAYWNQVANCHLNSGAHRKALLFYNKALEVNKDYVPALNNIGVMYSRQGQDQKALVAFERAAKHGRFSKTPRYNLARLYLTYGLAEHALTLFEGLLSEAPKDIDLLNATGTAHFILTDYQKALSFYQQIPQGEWRRAEYGINIAMTFHKLGRREDARKIFSGLDTPASGNLKRYFSSVQKLLGAAE